MTSHITDRRPPTVGRRLRASLADLLVIAGWFGILTLAGIAVRALLPGAAVAPPPRILAVVDVTVFVGTVLPAGLYLALGEAGTHQGAWGKRRAGLRVVKDGDGGRPCPGPIVLRTAVKLLPWQLAHIAVARLMLGVETPAVTWTAYALSLLIPAVSITMALRDPRRRALHDRVAGTRVAAVPSISVGGPARPRRGPTSQPRSTGECSLLIVS